MTTCSKCGIDRVPSEFYPADKYTCKACRLTYQREHRAKLCADPVVHAALKAKSRESRRRDPARTMMYYIRSRDLKEGREFNLSLTCIAALISQPCVYCGETEVSRGLDRIDNNQGHITGNVVPCCWRCNRVRGDMPINAWQLLAPAMRSAREAGAFRDWKGTMNRKQITGN